MRRTLRSVRTSLGALAMVVGLVGLVGCSGQAPDKGDLDKGDQETIAIEGADLTFELPAGWLELDMDEARAAATDKKLMAELVKRHGPDTERSPVAIFISTAGILGLPEPAFIASAKGVENDVLATIRLDVRPIVDEADDSLEEIQLNLPGGLEYMDQTDVDTAVGPAILAVFASTLQEPVHHQAQLILQADTTWVTFSFLTDDRDKAEQLVSDVAESLQPIS